MKSASPNLYALHIIAGFQGGGQGSHLHEERNVRLDFGQARSRESSVASPEITAHEVFGGEDCQEEETPPERGRDDAHVFSGETHEVEFQIRSIYGCRDAYGQGHKDEEEHGGKEYLPARLHQASRLGCSRRGWPPGAWESGSKTGAEFLSIRAGHAPEDQQKQQNARGNHCDGEHEAEQASFRLMRVRSQDYGRNAEVDNGDPVPVGECSKNCVFQNIFAGNRCQPKVPEKLILEIPSDAKEVIGCRRKPRALHGRMEQDLE